MAATRRKHRIVKAAVVLGALGLFALQWTQAPRVETQATVTRELRAVRGELYLGTTFEGLPLRRVRPFLYSDCEPGKPKRMPVPCEWVEVDNGVVAGGDEEQVARARERLRPVR